MTDILIIGGGPAGLTAAIYAARAGKTVTGCERESVGGQITHAHKVSNYPGLNGISGVELGDRLCAHAMDVGADVQFNSVNALTRDEKGIFHAHTDDGQIEAKAVIFAGGAKPRLLGVDNEEEMVGRGVSYCALCDGSFFAGQDVAVVGGGNSAFSDALFLASVCRSVTLVHRREGFRAEAAQIDAARQTENIRFLTGYTVESLEGHQRLQALGLRSREGESARLEVSGVFVALGRVADSDLIRSMVELDAYGYVASGEDCQTKTPGLFVAGDCRAKQVRQLTTATSDGTVAATAACEYLDMLK
jgi:thioredoxin reductase (NADPH)